MFLTIFLITYIVLGILFCGFIDFVVFLMKRGKENGKFDIEIPEQNWNQRFWLVHFWPAFLIFFIKSYLEK